MSDINQQIQRLLSHLLRPLARILLHRGIGYGEFAEAAKHAFVDAANHDLTLPGRKQTTSRISTLTGLSRKEVHRLLNSEEDDQSDPQHRLNRAARVIFGWSSDARFTDGQGRPLKLPFENADPDFSLLVKEYSGDITPRTIADELSRTGAIRQDSDGLLELIKQAYIPDANSLEHFKLIAQSIAELTQTIEHNIEHETDKFFQRKVYYDSIPQEFVADLKQQIAQKAQTCLEEINALLVQYDTDHNKLETDSDKARLGLAMYYFEDLPK